MNSNFKPLGIAAAVAVASAGYAGVTSAQEPMAPSVANNALGDLALVPYYTVNGEWLTGIHIVNSSDRTQVVKFRFRRATDSEDALDFNVVMSPKDVYAGYLSDEDGVISWQADDTSCTVPATTDGKLTMPPIYRPDGETGYVEIIAMGTPVDELEPIAVAAKHNAGVPLDCAAVRSNFFADGDISGAIRGVESATETYQDSQLDDDLDGVNVYEGSGNVLKVSYFIRDNASGVEFGDNAVHIQDFLAGAHITNQQYGYRSGDLDGFDYPNLNGGVPTADVPERGRFNALRASDVLGVDKIINEWTANTANGAALDWVVTLPGQYSMLDIVQYTSNLEGDFNTGQPWFPTVTASGAINPNPDCPRGECDFRDMPVTATIRPYNREELAPGTPEEDLVVSPAPPGTVSVLRLPKETNVISFGGNSVLGDTDIDISADLGQPYGWLSLAVQSADSDVRECRFSELDEDVDGAGYSEAAGDALTMECTPVGGAVPMIGFAAWARQVAANPDASYGRIVAHSFTRSAE